jgi:hypothetical protein
MRLFIFTSQAKPTIHAFSADSSGSKLPEKLAPWTFTRMLGSRQGLPHNLSREAVERGINLEGYQLWRLKAKPPVP